MRSAVSVDSIFTALPELFAVLSLRIRSIQNAGDDGLTFKAKIRTILVNNPAGILWWGISICIGRKVLYDLVYYQRVMTFSGKDILKKLNISLIPAQEVHFNSMQLLFSDPSDRFITPTVNLSRFLIKVYTDKKDLFAGIHIAEKIITIFDLL